MISSAIVEASGSVDVLQTIKAFCDELPQVAELEAQGVLQIEVADSKDASRITRCYLSHREQGPVVLAAGTHPSADARA